MEMLVIFVVFTVFAVFVVFVVLFDELRVEFVPFRTVELVELMRF